MSWNLKWSYSQLNRLLEDTTFMRRCAWSNVIGEVLLCCCDTQNCFDPLPLLHVKARQYVIVVGHIPYLDGYLRFVNYICFSGIAGG